MATLNDFNTILNIDYLVIHLSNEVFNNGKMNYHIALVTEDFSYLTGDKSEKVYNKIVAVRVFEEQPKHITKSILDAFGETEEECVIMSDYIDFGYYGMIQKDTKPYNSIDEAIQGFIPFIDDLKSYTDNIEILLDMKCNLLGNTWREQMNGELNKKK